MCRKMFVKIEKNQKHQAKLVVPIKTNELPAKRKINQKQRYENVNIYDAKHIRYQWNAIRIQQIEHPMMVSIR